jgi:hypothetical protein
MYVAFDETAITLMEISHSCFLVEPFVMYRQDEADIYSASGNSDSLDVSTGHPAGLSLHICIMAYRH